MKINILTIFPKMFTSPFGESIIKRAREKGVVDFDIHDVRDHAKNKHRMVDDTPYGGGAGMVMMAEPLVTSVEALPRRGKSIRVLLTPQGETFTQSMAVEFSKFDQLILICGRYEGIDERARELIADREVSVGDYILSGGEIPAMVVVDSVVRLLPGALGNEESIKHESFESDMLEYPQYTRPEIFREMRVPEVLLSGNHAEIDRWRRKAALIRTSRRRPDLLEDVDLTDEERQFLKDSKDKSGETL